MEDSPALPHRAQLFTFNAQEKYAHRRGRELCVAPDCHAPLIGEVAYRVTVPAEHAGDVWYGSMAAECCSEECARAWLTTRYRPRSYRLLTEGNPTEVDSEAWIHAICERDDYPEGSYYSGKWLVFLSEASIDRYWSKVKEALAAKLLGEHAKVSTKAHNPHPGRHVICVYSYDYRDREDAMRIREALRDLGIKRPIRYKADEDTSAMKYGSDYQPIYEA
jgi:hypothetical protein